jgi:CheY-like chemotaxis protein
MIGVLVVDDQEDIRLLIRMIIEAANHELYVSGEASGGSEALRRLDEVDPSVIVLDQMMPGMDGLTVADEIRKRRPDQIFVMCSAFVDDDLRREAAARGITICLPKTDMRRIPEVIRLAAAG